MSCITNHTLSHNACKQKHTHTQCASHESLAGLDERAWPFRKARAARRLEDEHDRRAEQKVAEVVAFGESHFRCEAVRFVFAAVWFDRRVEVDFDRADK